MLQDSAVEFRVLGQAEVSGRGRVRPIGGPKRRALLAALPTHADQGVSRDRLIGDLWGDSSPANAKTPSPRP